MLNNGEDGKQDWRKRGKQKIDRILMITKWQPTLVFLPGESHGLRSLVGYSPRGRKELDMTEPLHFTSLAFENQPFYRNAVHLFKDWSF